MKAQILPTAMGILVLIIITVLLMGFAAGPMSQASEEAIRTNARLMAMNIAGIINHMQYAPNSIYTYTLPAGNCTTTLDSDERVLKIEIKDANASKPIFSGLNIETNTIYCDQEKKKNMLINKTDGQITIEEES